MAKKARNNKAGFRLKLGEIQKSQNFVSQAALAKKLEVHPSVVNNFVAGRTFPTLRTTVDFAKKLNLKSLDELVEVPGVNA